MAVIPGTANNDSLVGGTDGDLITGLGGNDTLRGGDGADTIDGGIGDDWLYGEAGDDRILVDSGYDRVDGGDGTNTLVIDYSDATQGLLTFANSIIYQSDSAYRVEFGNIQSVDVTGGDFADSIGLATSGDDTVRGGAGNDILNTGAGLTKVDGGADVDAWAADLSASGANGILNLNTGGTQSFDGCSVTGIEAVSLTGGSGNERIITQTGVDHRYRDLVSAGGGNDTIGVGGGYDTVDGGAGVNRLVIDWSEATAGFISGQGASISGYFYQGNDDFRVDFNNIQEFDITGGAFADSFNTGNGSDTFDGGGGDDFINTAQGAATVEGGAGNDTWGADLTAWSGAGALDLRSVAAQSFDGCLISGIESVRLTAGSGDDSIITLAGVDHRFSDLMNGGDGNDTLGAGGGYDTINGGTGVNRMVIDWSEATAGFVSGQGISTTGYFYQGNNDFRVDFTGIQEFDVTGGGFNDVFNLGDGADTFNGGGGDDVVNTGAGTAVIDGGSGNDTWIADLSANSADGFIDLSLGGEQAFEGSQITALESLRVIGGSGDETMLTLTGDAHPFADSLNGGLGNDTLGVGGGYDTVDGGDGVDTMIVDFAEADAAIIGNGFSYLYQSNNGYRVDYANIEAFDFTGSAFNDNVTFLAGADAFHGNDGDDFVNTSAGAATVDGGAGNDTWGADFSADASGGTLDLNLGGAGQFYGGTYAAIEAVSLTLGDGVDRITTLSGVGQRFNDNITAGGGDDVVTVGGGYDHVNGGDGSDLMIVDFSLADAAIVTNGASYLYQSNDAVRVDYSGIEVFRLTGGAYNDNVTVGSGLGADTLDGGGGVDTLDARDGDDTLIGGAAGDSLVGGLGSDSASYITAGPGGVMASLATPGSNTSDASGDIYSSIENLIGSNGDDALTGDGGDNVLTGGAGNDTLDGGAHAAGGDTASYHSAAAGVSVSLRLAGGQATGGAGTDTLIGVENLSGSEFADTLSGSAGDNVIKGLGGIDTLSYAAAAGAVTVDLSNTGAQNTGSDGLDTIGGIENLVGSGQGDTLAGDGAANRIDGGAGIDTMSGGAKSDTYVVDATADFVTEASGMAAGAADLVLASADYVLSANVENLTLTGGADLDGTGNGSDNLITGNGGANSLAGAGGADTILGAGGDDTINGGAGADSMSGGAGADLYFADSLGDTVTETGVGTDTVRSTVSFTLGLNVENLLLLGAAGASTGTGNGSANTITGNGSANTLNGAGGADTLDGASGADSMTGGAGADLFIVDDNGDVVVEGSDADVDTVQSSVSFTLGDNLENLSLTGTANRTATGNGAANLITGNSGANTLDGGGAADTLKGGAGNDTYLVDATDTVSELAGGGTDTVRAAFSYNLGSEVENLVLLGALALTGSGNSAANAITANDAGDSLFGAGSADTLTGGAGADTLNGGTGADSMAGGGGGDLYLVDATADVISELASSGFDAVQASATYVLSNNLESLTLIGSGAINGTGNISDNLIDGGGGANSLSGGGGLDTLNGGNGADTLDGGVGADTLNGGSGADRMVGGNGGDLYVVDADGDVVVEAAGGGVDTVQSSITEVLAAEVENLLLTGSDHINGAGNGLDNLLRGNGKDNILNGRGGDDVLNGGKGKDTASYFDAASGVTVSLLDETAQDTGGAGIDTLTKIEHLIGSGFADLLTGSTKSNQISGGGGADTIDGGRGADVLTGGASGDTFVFGSAFESGRKAPDRITDLANADTIDLALVDADTGLAGDQAFQLVAAFDRHAGQLVVSFDSGTGLTTIAGDTDGDGKADLVIEAAGDHDSFSHFVL